MRIEPQTLRVEQGSIVALRLFDIAYAIDLSAAEALFAARTGTGASRIQISAPKSKAVAFDVPPLQLTFPPMRIEHAEHRWTARPGARLYDFGVIALSLNFSADGLPWMDYVAVANAIDRVLEGEQGVRIWRELLDRLRKELGATFTRPSGALIEEDYLLAVVQRWSEPLDAATLQETINLEALLSGESRPLSAGARQDLLRQRFSYFQDDLVVLTWDRAFVYEPRSETDVADVLEVANAQLLEMRHYDDMLDDELPRMYDLVENMQRGWHPLGPRRIARLARSLYAVVADITEITEKVDNALQVTEDVYLARVYSAALEQFRVPLVSTAVDRKLAIIRDTYASLYDEATTSRAGLMEAAIVILIVLELVLALVRH